MEKFLTSFYYVQHLLHRLFFLSVHVLIYIFISNIKVCKMPFMVIFLISVRAANTLKFLKRI